MVCHISVETYAFGSMTPRSQRNTQSPPYTSAMRRNDSSVLITVSRSTVSSSTTCAAVTSCREKPPWNSMVGVSGTVKTRNPRLSRRSAMRDIAVVLPPQGPPVRTMER